MTYVYVCIIRYVGNMTRMIRYNIDMYDNKVSKNV
jgi:hypothetical protein